jgi:NIPSNAP protein
MAQSQLRIYTIHRGRMEEFVELWRRSVLPLRRKLGFRVDGAWTVVDEDTFVWIVTYDGPGSFEDADNAYYDHPERLALSPDPADLIREGHAYLLSPVPEP